MGYAWRASEPAILSGPVPSHLERIALAARQHAAPAVTFALISERSAFDALEP